MKRYVLSCCFFTQLSEALQKMEEIAKRQNTISTVTDRITDGLISLDSNWSYTYINRKAADFFHMDPEQFLGQDLWSNQQEGTGLPFLPAYEESLREQKKRTAEVFYPAENLWLEHRIYPSSTGITILLADITEFKRQEKKSREQEKSGALLMDNLPGMAYRCKNDEDWTMTFVSAGCRPLTGYRPESLLNNRDMSFKDLINPEYRKTLRDLWAEVLREKTKFHAEYALTKSTGEVVWVFEQGQGVYDENGEVEALEGMIIDITDRKQRELEVEYLLNHDYLTGLYNRIYFEQLKDSLDRKKNLPLSIVIGDINGLKMMNDALGHSAGDKLIRDTAAIIQSCCREDDILSRIGGDEFGILLPRTDSDLAEQIVRQIKAECAEYNSNITNELMRINLSLGYATKDMADIAVESTTKLAEENMYKRKLLERKSLHSSIVSSIKTTMSARSQETEEHAERLASLAKQIGSMMNLQQVELNELELFATLHDIGKVGISDKILNKPGKLTDDEWTEMKKHSEIGYRIAMASPELVPVADFILSHHERWDGRGYPQGLEGKKIPLPSRILAVADSFDAMTENRVYRKAMPKEEALEEIRRNSGTQFDPQVASAFLQLMAKSSSNLQKQKMNKI